MNSKLHQQLGIAPDVNLIAVSKLQPLEKILEVHQKTGHMDFGENYVQEARLKQNQLQDYKFIWHLVGPLQRNKAKDVVGFFQLIHSVDSLRLAEKIDELASVKNIKQKLLFQINVADQDSKSGFTQQAFEENLDKLKNLKNIEVQGLMTMPPLTNSGVENRVHFKKLSHLLLGLQKEFPSAKFLSMGTTHDYRIALEEGATHIRLGTLIFGERAKL